MPTLSQPLQPPAIDDATSRAGLRAVASFEAMKGALVLVLMVILLSVHQHAEDFAESLLFHLHIDSDEHFSQAIMNAATRLSDTRLLTIAAAGIAYAIVRFVESWGLWNRRVWAEWFALLSGALYLPLEILKLKQGHWFPWTVFMVNLIIVLYMLFVRLRSFQTYRGNVRSYTQ
ncbi:MAG TPA: DUF2127 domain-containing protein [Bryobacteraceae bacterium]|nr:DUF2127 domain-containing protein [Bryobacteraceae bacterium]